MSNLNKIHKDSLPINLKSYEDIGKEIGKLISEKNIAYSNAVGKTGEVLKIIYPSGIELSQYKDATFITRIVDKLFRISSQKDAFEESPYIDIAGFAILGVKENEK